MANENNKLNGKDLINIGVFCSDIHGNNGGYLDARFYTDIYDTA